MGVNAHLRPGDLCVVIDDETNLRSEPGEDVYHSWLNDEVVYVGKLKTGTVCTVLGMKASSVGGGGHVFQVMAQNIIGWLWNFEIRPFG